MKLFLRTIFFLITITAFAPFASGQILYWAGGTDASASVGNTPPTTDNNFNTANNWSTVPPNAFFGPSGTPLVPGSSNVAIVQADLNNGTIVDDFFTFTNKTTPVLINQLTQSNTVQGLVISDGFVNGGIVNFVNSANHTLTVNGTNTNNGDFAVIGGATFNYSGGPFAVTKGTIVIGDGQATNANTLEGLGTFNIQSGSFTYDSATSQNKMIVGYAPGGLDGGAGSSVTEGSTTTAPITTTSANVTLGSSLIIGLNSSTGTWNVTNNSVLQTGTLGTSYFIALGSNGINTAQVNNATGSTGALNISGTSTFNLGTAGLAKPTDLQLGTTTVGNNLAVPVGGFGTITQSGNSTVNIAGTATTVEIGDLDAASQAAVVAGTAVAGTTGGIGIYNLQGGSLNIGTNATDDVTFTLGNNDGSSGTLNQGGGNLTVGSSTAANGTSFVLGSANMAGTSNGFGVYTLSGGTATFNNALTFTANGTLNLNGGTLNITTGHLAPVAGATLDFGGGTLKFTTGTMNNATWTDSFAGGALNSNTVSTIDASLGTITTVTINQTLSGGGGITLIGTDGTHGNQTTAFTFNGQNFGGANTYTGPTTIAGGTLNTTAANIENSSSLNILTNSNPTPAGTVSVGTLNLTLAAGGLAYNGALTGPGNLNVNYNTMNDALVIANASSFTGTINLGANGTAGVLQVYGGNFGNVTGAGDGVTIGGALLSTQPNAFTVPTTGSVTIGNATYTGPTTINSGFTLTVTGAAGLAGNVINMGGLLTPSIGGSVTSNSGLIDVTGATGIVGNVASVGTPNTGMIITPFVGGNVFNGVGGTFTTTSALNATSVMGNVTNAGTLASSTPLGAAGNATFTIGGTLTNTGTLGVRDNGNNVDLYKVIGAATVGGNFLVTGGGAVTNLPVLTSGALTDNGATASAVGANVLFFVSSLTQVGNSLDISTTQLGSAAGAAKFGVPLTPNETAVAGSLDPAITSKTPPIQLLTLFNSLTAPELPSALEQLSPESLQYARNIAFENSSFLAQRMNGITSDLRSGYGGLDTNAISVITPGLDSGLGRSLGSLLAYNDPAFHSSAPNGVNYYPGGASSGSSPSSESSSEPTQTWDSSSNVISDSTSNPYLSTGNPSGPETPRTSEFLAGDVILADLNQSQNNANAPSSKANYSAGDVTGGVSFRMTSHLAAGVLFDYNHTDADTDSAGSRTKIDSYSPGIFATYFDHGFYANGLFAFGYNDYNNTRKVLGDTANSSPNGQQYTTNVDFGYDFHPMKNWVVGPTLGLTYTHLNIDSFTETGASSVQDDLAVNSQSADSLRSRFGGHVIFQTNTGDVLLQPNLSLMWQHEYLDSSSGITSSFSDFGSSSFTINTAAPSRDSALIGLGLTATLSNSLALYLNYIADVGADDYWAQSVVTGFKARF